MTALTLVSSFQLKNHQSREAESSSDVNDFLEKVVYVVETIQANASNLDEGESLALETISLLGAATALALLHRLPTTLTQRIFRIFWLLRLERGSRKMTSTWFQALSVIVTYDTEGVFATQCFEALNKLTPTRAGTDEVALILSQLGSLDGIVATVHALSKTVPATFLQVRGDHFGIILLCRSFPYVLVSFVLMIGVMDGFLVYSLRSG